ncbi:uncharacterized protein FOMMEDRAFT_154779 [Fomitiporia mediterranea MF3/22]|uniref:uncharacterized protein n=1 Tax=Fomitiporia mediterranea (strain MF3/22) TaxID=694068 RepID=UPI0004408911|nr:uncharacterized protein FOMMEDRAFT_154779 [Fomitiporia mediterranea MF3/22]EJD03674.1 hypothetical protein FOMMEDRAFT_154779 [Fomitiporia mediterranea MF3/22]
MVSPLWIAADNGDVDQVHHLLTEASAIDIEIKDDTGSTPLVQAAKHGHIDIARALLNAGADPTVSTSHGSIEQLTTDDTILELIAEARDKKSLPDTDSSAPAPVPVPASAPTSEQQYMPHVPESYSQEYPAYGQVPPHPGSYMYYPPPFPGAMLSDGSPAPYYPPPPPPNSMAQPPENAGNGSLPPPEIARLIPCRYYPACRYGPSCIFAHPQGPFFPGPLPPPAQYSAPYDQMVQPHYGGYYGMPQPPYPQPPPSANVTSPPQNPSESPLAQPQHGRSGSEAVSPMQTPFSPAGMPPPPVPYGVPVPGGYPQHGQMPVQPMPMGVSPSQQPGPQPNGVIYSPASPVSQPPSMHRRDPSLLNGATQYPQIDNSATNPAQSLQIPPQQDAYANVARPHLREGANHLRRGSIRRMSAAGSANNRKPPCAFFPSGRCRNGDACKFPHILPESGDVPQGHYMSRFAGRARAQTQPQTDQLHEKMAELSLRPDGTPNTSQPNGHIQPNGFPRPNHFKPNGVRHEKRGGPNGRSNHQQPQQRLPSADDFPVLGGTMTPPARSPITNPLNGPTAAQVLKAPPPPSTKSDKASSVRTGSSSGPSENGSVTKDPDEPPNGEISGVNGVNGNGMNGSAPEIKPLSFAAVATVATSPGSAGTVSVSA